MSPQFLQITDVSENPVNPLTAYYTKSDGEEISIHFQGYAAPSIDVGSPVELPEPSFDHWKESPTENGDWGQVKRSGVIKMTPYSTGTRTSTSFVVSVPDCQLNPGQAARSWKVIEDGNSVQAYGPAPVQAYTEFNRNICYPANTSLYTLHRAPGTITDGAIAGLITDLKNRAVAESNQTWDVLTEIAELREVFQLADNILGDGTRALQKFFSGVPKKARGKTAKQLLNSSDAALRKVGSRWMQLRYAIMPLLYSFEDVKAMLDNIGSVYHTVRKSGVLEQDEIGEPDPGQTISLVEAVQDKVIVTVTVKARYSPSGIQSYLSDQLGLNPFVTAWELIPLSFVIDWFVNIGDWIQSNTRVNLATQKEACVAVRRTGTREVRVLADYTILSTAPEQWTIHPYTFYKQEVSVDGLTYQESWDTYDRDTFKPIVKFAFSPYLSWQRWVDGFVLSSKELRKILRRI